jgi:hypothetical protein
LQQELQVSASPSSKTGLRRPRQRRRLAGRHCRSERGGRLSAVIRCRRWHRIRGAPGTNCIHLGSSGEMSATGCHRVPVTTGITQRATDLLQYIREIMHCPAASPVFYPSRRLARKSVMGEVDFCFIDKDHEPAAMERNAADRRPSSTPIHFVPIPS